MSKFFVWVVLMATGFTGKCADTDGGRFGSESDLIRTWAVFVGSINSAFNSKRCNAVAELGIQLLSDNLDPFSIRSFDQHNGVIALAHEPHATVSMFGARAVVFGGYFFLAGSRHAPTVAEQYNRRNASPRSGMSEAARLVDGGLSIIPELS